MALAQTKRSTKFALGAVVELKSGGHPMTVRKTTGGVVDCVWSKSGEIKTCSIESHCLQPALNTKTHEDRLADLEKMSSDDD
jgi:uncharacterized protein YodC (DUF2158 family)